MHPWSDSNPYSQPSSTELTIFPRAANYSDLLAFLRDTAQAVEHEREYRSNGYRNSVLTEEPIYFSNCRIAFDVI